MMGTDIHFFAEKREGPGKPWTFLPAPPTEGFMPGEKKGDEGAWPYRYGDCDTTAPNFRAGYDNRYTEDGEEPDAYSLRDWFDDRNYRLFGMLANVRNGTGFAGCVTGEAVEPVLPADVVSPDGTPHTRGWPDDCCPELEAERERIGHTPTWLTVKEMLDYIEKMRDQTLTVIGVISGQQYEALRDHGKKPSTWWGSINGQHIITLDPRIYDLIPQEKIEHAEGQSGLREVETFVAYQDLPTGVESAQREALEHADLFASLRGDISATETDKRARVYVQAQWTRPADDYVERFEHMLHEMMAAAQTSPENIRAVFYFDS